MKFVSIEQAVACVRSHNRVFIHSVAAAPQRLIKALTARASELRDVEIVHLHIAKLWRVRRTSDSNWSKTGSKGLR
jgi:hypothetical protein